MKYLFVKSYEYEDYRITANKKNRIHIFWISMIRSMPTTLRKEIKQKLTDLELRGAEGKYDITGVKPFQFITRNGSVELQQYLNEFAVFVESDTEEVFKWKENIHNLLQVKNLS